MHDDLPGRDDLGHPAADPLFADPFGVDADADPRLESDPQWRGLDSVIDRLRATATVADGDAWVRQQASAAAMVAAHTAEVVPLPTSGHRRRKVRAAAIAAAVTLSVTGGLAAADELPRPLQAAVSRAAAVLHIGLPDGSDPPGPGATVTLPEPAANDTPPSTIPDLSQVPPLTGPPSTIPPVDGGPGGEAPGQEKDKDKDKVPPTTSARPAPTPPVVPPKPTNPPPTTPNPPTTVEREARDTGPGAKGD